MKVRYKQIAACYLILRRQGKILLLRRNNTGFMDGKYSLPAGHIEKNELARNCIIREAKEEVGIIIKPKDIKLVHLMHRQEYDDQSEKRFCLFWIAHKWSGVPKIIERDKCDDLRWFLISNPPQNIIPYIRQAIHLVNQKVFYSEFDWKN